MQQVSMKRINIQIPSDLLNEVETRAKEKNSNCSRFIREIREAYFLKLKKIDLRERPKEGYLVYAYRDQKISDEFKYAES
ncbi:MAG: hypothetical protein JSW07_23030 [bacterium]|nr:MAG: hypothetical protein JSW07_23030 [bacterium]